MTVKMAMPARGLMDSQYAVDKRELMDLVNKIRSTGAEVEVDLPTIVVAGNQSSGKSSLIEAISGINLPRADGTCTRVPIEVRLRSEEDREWRCIVKIRREVGEEGAELVTSAQRLETDFGEPIKEPDQVDKVIRRAQLAILNPQEPSSKYVNHVLDDDNDTTTKSFSRNVIVLDISGPNVTDLTLVDLPGIFSSVAHDKDPGDILLVEELVKSYISRECLILLVITTKDDFENQKAVMLARGVDPERRRTIGVLTKVDTLKGLENDRWVKVLKGEREPLIHGYFATRQPDLDELSRSISFEEARAKEAHFFKTTMPWCDDLSFKDRLGTKNLSSALSTHLLNLIRKQLPQVIHNIKERSTVINEQLFALGQEPSKEPVGEMLGLVDQFARIVRGKTVGDEDKSLIQEINALNQKYRKQVWSTRPRVDPFTEDERKGPGEEASFANVLLAVPEFNEDSEGDSGATHHVLDLTAVYKAIELAITRELPGTVPPSATNDLISKCTSAWKDLAEDLLGEVCPVIQKAMREAIHSVFGRHKHGDLPGAVGDIVDDTLDSLVARTRELLVKTAELEQRPYTMNAYYLADVKSKIQARLMDTRYPDPIDSRDDGIVTYPTRAQTVKEVLAGLQRLGFEGLSEADLAKLRPTDRYTREIEVMALVCAYWKVAFKRIIDNIPRVIDQELVCPAPVVLRQALVERLHLTTSEGFNRCAKWLAESADVKEKRAELNHRRQVLEDAKAAIRAREFGST